MVPLISYRHDSCCLPPGCFVIPANAKKGAAPLKISFKKSDSFRSCPATIIVYLLVQGLHRRDTGSLLYIYLHIPVDPLINGFLIRPVLRNPSQIYVVCIILAYIGRKLGVCQA